MSAESPFETPTFEQKELLPATIRIELHRHDRKERQSTGDRQGDEFIRLTEDGRLQASEAGKSMSPQPEVAVAMGSLKERALETSLRHMFANEDSITPEMSLEDMRALADANLVKGHKHAMIEELDFNLSGTPEFNQEADNRYLNAKDYVAFMFRESDNLALELGDESSSTLSRMAANIAKIIQKYEKILPNWQRATEQTSEDGQGKYAEYDNQMQRFLGTHGGVPESFLLRVIQKIDGAEAAETFLQELTEKGQGNGFNFSEGYSIVIHQSEDGEVMADLTYQDKTWVIRPEVLQEITQDATHLNEEIAAKKAEQS